MFVMALHPNSCNGCPKIVRNFLDQGSPFCLLFSFFWSSFFSPFSQDRYGPFRIVPPLFRYPWGPALFFFLAVCFPPLNALFPLLSFSKGSLYWSPLMARWAIFGPPEAIRCSGMMTRTLLSGLVPFAPSDEEASFMCR